MANPKECYEKLRGGERNQFLSRGRHNSLLTLPSILPLEGQNGQNHLYEPYQGTGARAVMHLSSRMSNALLPAGRPFLRLDIPPEVKLRQGGEVDGTTEKGLSLSEQMIQHEIDIKMWRSSTFQSLQHLIVTGNVLEHILPDNRIRLFRLDQYVVRRNYDGSILEIVIEECMTEDALPPELRDVASKVRAGGAPKREGFTKPNTDGETLKLYTRISKEFKKGDPIFVVQQSLEDHVIPGTKKEFKANELPFNALRWSELPGEDYGRSKVEEHVADLRSLENLTKATLEHSAMASRNFIMVKASATAGGLKERLTRASNGDVIVGDPDEVDLKSFTNNAGFQLTMAEVQELRKAVADAFLLQSVGQRDAERVTATEIQRDIAELEAALGGNFSTLSGNMMLWRTQILLKQMKSQGKLPPFADGDVVPTILVGLEALSRERDVGRAQEAANIVNAFGPDAVDVVKLDKVIGRAFIGLGFPDSVRTDEEVAQVREQKAQLAAAQQAAGPVAGELAKQAGAQGEE